MYRNLQKRKQRENSYKRDKAVGLLANSQKTILLKERVLSPDVRLYIGGPTISVNIILRVRHQVINAVKQSIIMHCANTTKKPKPTQIIFIIFAMCSVSVGLSVCLLVATSAA